MLLEIYQALYAVPCTCITVSKIICCPGISLTVVRIAYLEIQNIVFIIVSMNDEVVLKLAVMAV